MAWRTLNLENEYLLCRILPDLGGHLYNCRDKLSNREVFYANPVIKKDLIGLRGAWIATGIESNFPATHSRVSASPVNFAIRNETDGAADVIVADTDRVTGMQWRVEYRLRPGAAVLEQQVSAVQPDARAKSRIYGGAMPRSNGTVPRTPLRLSHEAHDKPRPQDDRDVAGELGRSGHEPGGERYVGIDMVRVSDA